MPGLDTLTIAVTQRLQAAQIIPTADGSWTVDTAMVNAGATVPGSLSLARDAVVLMEDAKDLQTEINKAIGQIGCLVLVGMPHFINTATEQNPNVHAKVSFAVAIGEHPILWRKQNRPTARQLALIVSQILHGYKIDGFQYLRVLRADFVPDPKRQLYEVAVETLLVAPTLNN